MHSMALVRVVLLDSLILDKLNLSLLLFLLCVLDPGIVSNHCENEHGVYPYVGTTWRLTLDCVAFIKCVVNSVLK
jgi:hypothetical protein